MDNKKIGELIKRLRINKGLTQEQLGDMVGVGFRSVSKWERGITLPDISIINDVSKILGITSDELLSGELNEETITNTKKKNNKRTKLIISILLVIILITLSIFIYQKNKTYVYELESIDKDYNIEGIVEFKKNKLTINLNKLQFNDNYLNSLEIKNYEFRLVTDKKILTGKGNIYTTNLLDKIGTVQDINDNFTIYYSAKNTTSVKTIEKTHMILKMTYLDIADNITNVEIEILLKKSTKK